MNYSIVQPNEKLSDQESVTTQRAGDNTTTTTNNDKSSHHQQKQPVVATTTTTRSHAATTKTATASAAAAAAVSSSINASASNTTSTISSSPTTSNNPNNATAPFPIRLHQLLEDSTKYGFDDIIGWQPGGTSFKVYKVEKFASDIMMNYFIRQTKYKSFQRQISTYGFRRIEKGPLKNGYMHPNFTRDKPPDLEILSRKIRGPSPRQQQQQQQQQQLNPSSPSMSNKSTSPSPTKVGVGDSKTTTTTATSNKGDQDVAASGTAGVMMMASLSSAEQQHKEGNDSMSTIDDFGLDHQDFRNLHLSLSKATKLKDDPNMTTTGSKGNDEDDELSPILDPFADEDNNILIRNNNDNDDHHDDDVPILPQQQQHDIQPSMGTASATTTTATTTIQETTIVAGATNTMLMIDRSESRFPWKLYDMLEDATTENFTHIVSWVERGNAFKVHNESEFVSKVMPQYFDQTKFESFKRQLNMYGFSSVRKGNKGDKERSGIVNHPCFLRGHKDLCSEITRRQENDIWHVI